MAGEESGDDECESGATEPDDAAEKRSSYTRGMLKVCIPLRKVHVAWLRHLQLLCRNGGWLIEDFRYR